MTDQKDEQTPLEAEILREVAEEMQEEQIKKLWKKISPFVVKAVILALVATGGFEFYKSYEARRSLEESEQLKTALSLIESDEAEKGAEILKTLSETSGRGYRYLASFHYADYLIGRGRDQYEEAIHVLSRIINDNRAPQPFKRMALLDRVILQLENNSADSESLQTELDELIVDGDGLWAATALEISAEMALRQNDVEKALEYWKELMDLTTVPETKRLRVAEYISFAEGNLKAGK